MLSLVLASLLTAAPAEPNVIFITWDGVRWQDFFARDASAPFQKFWSKHEKRCTVFGDPAKGQRFDASNRAFKSLPSYQEMMVGGAVPCASNGCGRVKAETLIDSLVRAGLGSRMAIVASWNTIADAVSPKEHAFVDAGRHDGDPPAPWGEARRDADTWRRAMTALEKRPRFLWISLNDADEWAHRGSRDTYVATLSRYDIWFDELVSKLASMKGYGEHTTIVVTTDHGRGDGADWTSHNDSLPMAQRVFAFALGPGTGAPSSVEVSNHHALRPTIEALLGVQSARAPLAGVLPGVPASSQASP